MTTNTNIKPPVWFWIVSVLALLWNFAGVGAYLQQAYTSIEDLEAMTQAERLLHESQPAWATAAFAIAVFAGAFGCIGLLLRKKWANLVLLISLMGILAQQTYHFFLSNTFEVVGSEAMFMPVLVIIIGILLVFLARSAAKKGWLA